MKEIDILLAKYENCELSLQEEADLKRRLLELPGNEYALYKQLFNAYAELNKNDVTAAHVHNNIVSKLRVHTPISKRRIFQYAYLSVAASIVLAVGFFGLTQQKEAFVIEQGVRYDDMEKAVGCADEAVTEAIAPLKSSMQSLQPIKGLEGSLKPSYMATAIKDSSYKVRDDSMMKSRN